MTTKKTPKSATSRRWRKMRCFVEVKVPPTDRQSELDWARAVQFALDSAANIQSYPSRAWAKPYIKSKAHNPGPRIRRLRKTITQLSRQVADLAAEVGEPS